VSNVIGILIGLPTHENERSFHLLMSSWIFLFSNV
jgi:hypothetical protein